MWGPKVPRWAPHPTLCGLQQASASLHFPSWRLWGSTLYLYQVSHQPSEEMNPILQIERQRPRKRPGNWYDITQQDNYKSSSAWLWRASTHDTVVF